MENEAIKMRNFIVVCGVWRVERVQGGGGGGRRQHFHLHVTCQNILSWRKTRKFEFYVFFVKVD